MSVPTHRPLRLRIYCASFFTPFITFIIAQFLWSEIQSPLLIKHLTFFSDEAYFRFFGNPYFAVKAGTKNILTYCHLLHRPIQKLYAHEMRNLLAPQGRLIIKRSCRSTECHQWGPSLFDLFRHVIATHLGLLFLNLDLGLCFIRHKLIFNFRKWIGSVHEYSLFIRSTPILELFWATNLPFLCS
jgi:hypothetical protein